MSLVLLALVVFAAFVVESAAGFGATVVTVTLAAQLFPIELVLAALVPVNLILSSYIVLRHRRSIDTRLLVRRILPFMGVGLVGGLVAFQLRGEGWLKPAFALFVATLSAVELWSLRRAAGVQRSLPPLIGETALVAGGFVHGLFACGGPLVVYFAGREIDDKARFRSTLGALWLVMNSILVATYFVSGSINLESGRLSLVMLLPLGAGIVAGEWMHGRLAERTFRRATFGLLFFAGLALLASSLR